MLVSTLYYGAKYKGNQPLGDDMVVMPGKLVSKMNPFTVYICVIM